MARHLSGGPLQPCRPGRGDAGIDPFLPRSAFPEAASRTQRPQHGGIVIRGITYAVRLLLQPSQPQTNRQDHPVGAA